MTFKKRQVVMLHTNEKARERQLVLFPNKPYLWLGIANRRTLGNKYFDGDESHYKHCHSPEGLGMIPQHLYITSNEKIEVDDCCLLDWEGKGNENDIRVGKVLRISKNKIQMTNQYGNESHCDKTQFKNASWNKVIATTDSSLLIFDPDNPYDPRSKTGLEPHCFPQPSQAFIEKFVSEYNKGNVIKDVLVEYEEDFGHIGKDYDSEDHKNALCMELIKVSKDNTITIKKVKDSWSREEVISIHKANCERLTNSYIYSDIEWIEENL